MFRGQSSPASDWYAFGVTLLEALSGRQPFTGSLGGIIEQKTEPRHLDHFLVGAPVAPELLPLIRALLSPDPASRPDGAQVLEQLGGSPPAPQTPPISSGFFGRTDELDRLRAALSLSRAGRPQMVVLSGESGIGKTMLARSFVERARAEWPDTVALFSRTGPRESVSFKALDGLMDALSHWLSRNETRIDSFLPRDLAPLTGIFPVLTRIPRVAELVTGAEMTARRRGRAAAALAELLGRIADRHALILLIDDVQWGDADSGAFLADVLAAQPAPRLMLLCTCRPMEVDPPFLAEFREPAGAGRAAAREELKIGPLDEQAARSLAECLLDSPSASIDSTLMDTERRDSLVREAEGSPLFLRQLAAMVGERAEAPLRWLEAARVAAAATAWSFAAELFGRAQAGGGLDKAELREARLGEALALGASGRRAASARLCLELALESGGQEASRLRLEAGEHLVRSGQVKRGLALFRQVAGGAGYRLPGSLPAALLAFAWQRLRIWLRGYHYTLRPETELPESTRWSLDPRPRRQPRRPHRPHLWAGPEPAPGEGKGGPQPRHGGRKLGGGPVRHHG